ncbi:MAG: tetratricopeptide repeat protein, partial [Planctomycetota bacterium]
MRAFEAEIAESPDDPANYAHAAEWLVGLWCYGFCTRADSFDRARQLVVRGLQLGVPSAHLSTLHGVLCMGDWRWPEAARAFDQAFEHDAEMPMTHHWHALLLSARGEHTQAIASSERAVALDPSVGNQVGLGASLYFARDFERLAAQMQAVVEEDPDFAEAYDWLGMALVQLERFEESVAAYEKAYALSDGLAEINAGRGHA